MVFGQNTYGGGVYSGGDGGQSSFQPIILQETPKRHFWRKILIVGVITLILATIGGIIIGIIVSRDADLKNMKQEAKELYSLVNDISYVGQCPAVVGNVSDIYVRMGRYESYASACRERMEKVQNYIDDVAHLSDDDEYKNLYLELKTAISNEVVLGSELDRALEICVVWHEWRLALERLSIYQTSEDIMKFANKLIDLQNETLTNYATEWADARTKLVEAYIMDGFDSVSYKEARQAYDAVVDNIPDISLVAGFSDGNRQVLNEALMKYNQYVEEVL